MKNPSPMKVKFLMDKLSTEEKLQQGQMAFSASKIDGIDIDRLWLAFDVLGKAGVWVADAAYWQNASGEMLTSVKVTLFDSAGTHVTGVFELTPESVNLDHHTVQHLYKILTQTLRAIILEDFGGSPKSHWPDATLGFYPSEECAFLTHKKDGHLATYRFVS